MYEGLWNGVLSAFKAIPTKRDGTEYTTNSNGPYEYYMQVTKDFIKSRFKEVL